MEWPGEREAEMTEYVAKGSVRGTCGYVHRTVEGAARCALRDQRACHRLGGGAYSDRIVERSDGSPMTEEEYSRAEEIMNPEH